MFMGFSSWFRRKKTTHSQPISDPQPIVGASHQQVKSIGLEAKIREIDNEQTKSANSVVYGQLGKTGAAGSRNASRYYYQISTEGYDLCPAVRRSVNLKADSIAAMPWKITDASGDEVEDHPILDLLRNPNQTQTANEFWEQAMLFLSAGGGCPFHAQGANAAQEPVRPGQAQSNPSLVTALYVYRPDQLEIVSGPFGMPSKYIWNGAGSVNFPVDQKNGNSVIRLLKFANAQGGDPYRYGTPSLKSAAFAIDMYNEAMRCNRSLLENNAVVPGYYRYTGPDTLSPDQINQYNDAIRKQLAGSNNKGTTPFLGNMEFVGSGLGPDKMAYEDMLHVATREIGKAEGVPSQMLGVPGDSTYANYEQARLSFYLDTMLPLVQRITDMLNSWLVPMWDSSLSLSVDLDGIEALEPIRRSKWEKVAAADFLTANEKRREVSFQEADEAEADQLLIPAGMVPLSMINSRELDAMKSGLGEKGFSKHAVDMITKEICCIVEEKSDVIEPETSENSYFFDKDSGDFFMRGDNGFEVVA